MSKGNYTILGCPRCGDGKNNMVHSYGQYRVYKKGTNIKLVCKTCKYVIRYRYIEGGQNNE